MEVLRRRWKNKTKENYCFHSGMVWTKIKSTQRIFVQPSWSETENVRFIRKRQWLIFVVLIVCIGSPQVISVRRYNDKIIIIIINTLCEINMTRIRFVLCSLHPDAVEKTQSSRMLELCVQRMHTTLNMKWNMRVESGDSNYPKIWQFFTLISYEFSLTSLRWTSAHMYSEE